jgi:hypothetical protein
MAEDGDRPVKTRAVVMTVWYSFFVGAHWLALASSARILVLALVILGTAFTVIGILFAPKDSPPWGTVVAMAINMALWAWFISRSAVVGAVACAVLSVCIAFTVRELWAQASLEREYHEQEKR